MSQFDHLDLDGHLLQLLLAVIEEGSVTRAAQRLGVTQSAVSHLLDKLRAITGDPLFVKSGRGIVPTAHAQLLALRARALLDDLRSFSHAAAFDPAQVSAQVTIAANDLQRDLLRIWEEHRKTVLFVTHSVEEAVFLSDKVVMMSRSPGRIREVIDIDLPRPRRREELLLDPRYQNYIVEIERMFDDSGDNELPS